MLSMAVVFAFGAMCTGGGGETTDEDPVVVPVDGDGEEAWCCEYKDNAGATQYALVDGPSECNDKFGDQDGRYVSGNQCLPCCCETEKDPDDASAGLIHELTTPKSCANVDGECRSADAKECSGDEAKKKTPVRRPQPRRDREVRPPTRGGDRGGERRTR